MVSAERHLRAEVKVIPGEALKYAKGLIFLTMVKGAFIWSAALSTGIIVKRLSRTRWSPPCSLGMASFGVGLQAGGQKVDVIIIIGDDEEIETFCGSGQLKLGIQYGLAAGPIGRDLDLSAFIGPNGLTCSVFYSQSKGLFAGLSLEGALLVSRWTANDAFYGQKRKVADILAGKVKVPEQKAIFVEKFHDMLMSFEKGKLDPRIEAGGLSANELEEDSDVEEPSKPVAQETEPDQTLLLHFSSLLGKSGKDLLKSSLASDQAPKTPEVIKSSLASNPQEYKTIYVIQDHVVDEKTPIIEAFNIITVYKGEQGVIIEGNWEKGLGDDLEDYVRVRINRGGASREGLVSKYVILPL